MNACLWTVVLLGAYPMATQAQRVRVLGTVVDHETGKPIEAAAVRLVDSEFSTQTDDRGRFLFSDIAPGDYRIEAARLGYNSNVGAIQVGQGLVLEITIRLSSRPVELKPIEVVTRSGRLTEVGFYDRQYMGGLSGRFITRDDIERRNASQLTDILQDVQGVRVLRTDIGKPTVRFNRHVTEAPSAGRPPRYALQGPRNALDARGCEPDLYIDGRLHREASPQMVTGGTLLLDPPLSNVDNFNTLPVTAIEGVEVYVGATVPIFVKNTACGAILLWTRR